MTGPDDRAGESSGLLGFTNTSVLLLKVIDIRVHRGAAVPVELQYLVWRKTVTHFHAGAAQRHGRHRQAACTGRRIPQELTNQLCRNMPFEYITVR